MCSGDKTRFAPWRVDISVINHPVRQETARLELTELSVAKVSRLDVGDEILHLLSCPVASSALVAAKPCVEFAGRLHSDVADVVVVKVLRQFVLRVIPRRELYGLLIAIVRHPRVMNAPLQDGSRCCRRLVCRRCISCIRTLAQTGNRPSSASFWGGKKSYLFVEKPRISRDTIK